MIVHHASCAPNCLILNCLYNSLLLLLIMNGNNLFLIKYGLHNALYTPYLLPFIKPIGYKVLAVIVEGMFISFEQPPYHRYGGLLQCYDWYICMLCVSHAEYIEMLQSP